MSGQKRPEVDTEEYIQNRMEQQIREQYELHGWATGISVANPLEILIKIEEDEDFDSETTNETKTLKGRML